MSDHERNKDSLLIELSVAVEHILRKLDNFWPDNRKAVEIAERLGAARKNFEQSR